MATYLKIMVIFSTWLLNEVCAASRYKRLSLAEPSPNYHFNHIQGYPGTYTFGYDVSDHGSGNMQYRKEERFPNGTVMGSYGYLDPFGDTRRYQYIADKNGYRVYNMPKLVEPSQTFNSQKASTESSVTWTRPSKSKKKKTQNKPLGLKEVANNNKYYDPKPPSFYAID